METTERRPDIAGIYVGHCPSCQTVRGAICVEKDGSDTASVARAVADMKRSGLVVAFEPIQEITVGWGRCDCSPTQRGLPLAAGRG